MVFGFFGLGVQELIILLVIGLLLVGIPVMVLLFVWLAMRSGKKAARAMELEEENRLMREELERRERGAP